ncbi:DNA cytosine methyltransferase [Corynebacterium dentalis]|uniref:DNA cytosine methyltransferase n=1 Tax=Corynebacterium dentalis TaxID=2014528 RepID=UPI0028A1639B|nr:DNA cytosine methyltransferase [Corynebacterium dentalis]
MSTFTGCGGLDLGFRDMGFDPVWANDLDESACSTYQHSLGDHIVCEDITKIDPFTDQSIPPADLVIGGFPCQDFSIIWKRPGLDGARGGLYRNFRDFIAAKRPKAFVAENVKGLLTANNKLAIKTIVEDLEAVSPGYIVKPRLYNFAEYGVPQFRERVLIVGVRMDTGFDFRHPKPTHGPRGRMPYKTAGEALRGVEKISANNEIMRQREKTRQMLTEIPEGGNYTNIPKDHPLYVKGLISHVYRRLHRDEPSRTIIAAGGGGTWGYHFEYPRALTNRERARLQSFPDWFQFQGSTTEVRRQIGNAVPPEGVHALAKRLQLLFKGDYEPVDLHAISKQLKGMSIAERVKLAEVEID